MEMFQQQLWKISAHLFLLHIIMQQIVVICLDILENYFDWVGSFEVFLGISLYLDNLSVFCLLVNTNVCMSSQPYLNENVAMMIALHFLPGFTQHVINIKLYHSAFIPPWCISYTSNTSHITYHHITPHVILTIK